MHSAVVLFGVFSLLADARNRHSRTGERSGMSECTNVGKNLPLNISKRRKVFINNLLIVCPMHSHCIVHWHDRRDNGGGGSSGGK